MNKFKRIGLFATAFLGLTAFPLTCHADFNDCLNAYANHLRTNQISAATFAYPTFALAYVDEDDIPELMMAGGSGHIDRVHLFTYADGQVIPLDDHGIYGTMVYAANRQNRLYDYTGDTENPELDAQYTYGIQNNMLVHMDDYGYQRINYTNSKAFEQTESNIQGMLANPDAFTINFAESSVPAHDLSTSQPATGSASTNAAYAVFDTSVQVKPYQGYFMNSERTLSMPLYTSRESSAIGIVYEVANPRPDGYGGYSYDIINTVGEIMNMGSGYGIAVSAGGAGLEYYNGGIRITGDGPYTGDYVQISNAGANMSPAMIWWNIPETIPSGNSAPSAAPAGNPSSDPAPSGNASSDPAAPSGNASSGTDSDGYLVTSSGGRVGSASTEYMLPDSQTTIYFRDDLTQLSSNELSIARNEIYARHGRRFKSAELQQHFGSKSWYNPTYTPEQFDPQQDQIFTAIEKANIKVIQSIENSR